MIVLLLIEYALFVQKHVHANYVEKKLQLQKIKIKHWLLILIVKLIHVINAPKELLAMERLFIAVNVVTTSVQSAQSNFTNALIVVLYVQIYVLVLTVGI